MREHVRLEEVRHNRSDNFRIVQMDVMISRNSNSHVLKDKQITLLVMDWLH